MKYAINSPLLSIEDCGNEFTVNLRKVRVITKKETIIKLYFSEDDFAGIECENEAICKKIYLEILAAMSDTITILAEHQECIK